MNFGLQYFKVQDNPLGCEIHNGHWFGQKIQNCNPNASNMPNWSPIIHKGMAIKMTISAQTITLRKISKKLVPAVVF